MRTRLLLLTLGFLGVAFPALAQEYPGGLIIPPIPAVPGVYPGGAVVAVPPMAPHIDVSVTGSVQPRLMGAFSDVGAMPRRTGCEVKAYSFGPDTRVRVHRC